MQELLCESCKAHPDLSIKSDTRPKNKFEYYSYILFYVYDILCIHHDPDDVLNKLTHYVPLKPGSVGSPDMYIGTKLKQMQLHNGIWAWSMSPSILEVVGICKEYVANHLSKGPRLPKRTENPFAMGFCPKFDVPLYWTR